MAVRFEYMYRDASNYKEHAEAIFAGNLVGSDGERLRAVAEDGENFVASQVGLEPLQPRMISFPSPDDHGYSELPEDYEPEEAPEEAGVTDSRTWKEFLADFEREGARGWDPVAECELLGIDPLAGWEDTAETEEE